MGAAGLTSSSVEMAGRADNGVEIDLDRVPRRAKAMTPYEILLSESQERMLLVAKPGKEARVLEICARWDLDAAVIGKVTDSKRWVVKATPGYDPLASPASKPAPVVVCDIPIGILTDGAPIYDRPCAAAKPAVTAVGAATVPVPTDLGQELLDLVGSPNVGSRAWIWRQYDQIVRGGTVVRPGSDAAVVRVPCGRQRAGEVSRVRGRLQRSHVRARSVRGRRERHRGGLPQPGHHGRRADRDHRLPQLRQPRAARGDGHLRPRHRRDSPLRARRSACRS